MVYKKFLEKDGKTFGPYYYESFREDGKVKKVYIGGKKEYRAWKKKKDMVAKKAEKKSFGGALRGVVNRGCSTLGFLKNRKFLLVVLLGMLVLFGGMVVVNNFDNMHRSLAGFVVLGNGSEGVVERFEGDVDLEIKSPVESLGLVLSENKNERMDFDLATGKLRLYFDVLNYSEFVKDVAEGIVSEEVLEEVVPEVEVPVVVENVTEVPEINETEVPEINETEEVETNITEEVNETEEVVVNETEEVEGNVTEVETPVGVPPSSDEGNETVEVPVEVNETEAVEVATEEISEEVPEVSKKKEEEVGKEKKEKEEKKEKKEKEVEEEEESDAPEVGFVGNVIRNIIGFTARVVGVDLNETVVPEVEVETVVVDVEKVKEKVDELSDDELEVISDGVVVPAGDFEIDVTEEITEEMKRDAVDEYGEEPNYKWGYNVRLNDLKFMAKIDISAEEALSVYDNRTLRIGRNLLSFSDLVAEGYTIKFETPALEIDEEVVVKKAPKEKKEKEEVEVAAPKGVPPGLTPPADAGKVGKEESDDLGGNETIGDEENETDVEKEKEKKEKEGREGKD